MYLVLEGFMMAISSSSSFASSRLNFDSISSSSPPTDNGKLAVAFEITVYFSAATVWKVPSMEISHLYLPLVLPFVSTITTLPPSDLFTFTLEKNNI
ncbi:hypothetical protein TYRP_004990 [Tyrophagus putrescentiae]|nr:hypothetical protein TYRP_004990 [Tyrophagus putrescentiae]